MGKSAQPLGPDRWPKGHEFHSFGRGIHGYHSHAPKFLLTWFGIKNIFLKNMTFLCIRPCQESAQGR